MTLAEPLCQGLWTGVDNGEDEEDQLLQLDRQALQGYDDTNLKTVLNKDSPVQKYVSSTGWRKEARPLSCLQPTASIDLKSKKVFPFKEFTHTPLLFPLQEIDLPRCTDRHN